MAYIYPYNITESNFTALKILCARHSHLSPHAQISLFISQELFFSLSSLLRVLLLVLISFPNICEESILAVS